MSLSATANPTSGTTPCTFDIDTLGGVPPLACAAKPSPPNPSPMPDHVITGPDQNGKFEVEIIDTLVPAVVLWFTVTDGNADSADASYTTT